MYIYIKLAESCALTNISNQGINVIYNDTYINTQVTVVISEEVRRQAQSKFHFRVKVSFYHMKILCAEKYSVIHLFTH